MSKQAWMYVAFGVVAIVLWEMVPGVRADILKRFGRT
jgi:hypothetical protein